jgi:Ni/Fe-hydrogenase subunit HybB-like protein
VNAGRVLLYFVGVLLVIAALAIFFMQTGLSKWVPTGLLAAGVLLIIGLAVMSFADSAPADRTVHEHGRHDDEGDVNIVNR